MRAWLRQPLWGKGLDGIGRPVWQPAIQGRYITLYLKLGKTSGVVEVAKSDFVLTTGGKPAVNAR